MSLPAAEIAVMNPDYTFISRWMHKTLEDWRIALATHGGKVLVYEEYIDFTTNSKHFEKFMQILGEYCPNLTHVRLLFSFEKNEEPEDGIVKSVLRLPNLQCLSLYDAPTVALLELKNDFSQLNTLNLSGVDESITTQGLADILGSIRKLHSLVYNYKNPQDQFVAALKDLTELKALTLLHVPQMELIQLKHCNQLEILNIYNIIDKLNTEDFLDIFKKKNKLTTLSINLLDENSQLSQELHKLDAYCTKLTYITLIRDLDNFGNFVKLKYLHFDMDDNNLDPIDMEELLKVLSPKYAERLEILDISRCPKHTHTMNITKLKRLKALLCWSWPSNLYKCLKEFEDLQFVLFKTNVDNSVGIVNLIENCEKLLYLCMPLESDIIDVLIQTLPDLLHRRDIKPEKPFVLSLVDRDAVAELEDKLKTLPHGNLLHLDWNAQVFTSKLKDLIAFLDGSKKERAAKAIYKNPSKMPGDLFEPEDLWLSNMNYRIALKSLSNKFNLEYDEMLVNRCREMNIRNKVYVLKNMEYAMNFKYDALDKYNECHDC